MESQVRDILAAHARMPGDAHNVDSSADLYQLGLTSHASVNVMLAIEDEFDVEFPDGFSRRRRSRR
jgi:acyl carrier protein